MKIIFSLAFFGLLMATAEASGKFCRQRGDTVCVVNARTNQCGHTFSREDGGNPMYRCRQFIGEVRDSFDRSKYYCKERGGDVCAASIRTNQCTHSWSREDGNPLYKCQRFLGLRTSNYNPANYYCDDTASGVCARSRRTGQCTHTWSDDDHHNPMWACRRHLGN